MPEIKTKRPTRKVAKAANSPMPHAATCGHSGCGGGGCNVRYAGPTSHTRDHYIRQAAHGVSHVWTAAVVAGLAVVMTGAIAYSAVQAESAPKVRNVNEAVAAIWRRLDSIDRSLAQINSKLSSGQTGTTAQQNGGTKPQEQVPECAKTCRETHIACSKAAGTDQIVLETCASTAMECVKAACPVPQKGDASGTGMLPLRGGQGGGFNGLTPVGGGQNGGQQGTSTQPQ